MIGGYVVKSDCDVPPGSSILTSVLTSAECGFAAETIKLLTECPIFKC